MSLSRRYDLERDSLQQSLRPIRSVRLLALRARRSTSASALSASLLASAAVQALNVVTGIVLARTLGPAGRGELTTILLWPFLLAAVGSLGVTESVTYFAARRPDSAATITGTAGALALVQSVVLVAIGAIVLPIILAGHKGNLVGPALLFLAVIPLNLLILYLMGVLNGLHRYRWFHSLRLLVIAVAAAGLLSCWLTGTLTVRTAIVVYLIAHVLTLAGAIAGIARSHIGRPMFDRHLVPRLIAYGLKSHTSNVPSMLNERLDQLVISIFLAPTMLGLYVVAVTMTSITNLIGSSVSYVALPTVARLSPGDERTTAARQFIVFTIFLSSLATVPLIIFTGPVIALLFGDAFDSATNVCRVLLVAAVVLSTTRALGAILKAINRPLDAGIAETIALVVTFAALAVLLPSFGLMGAGIASLLAYVVSCAVSIRQAARALGISPRLMLLPRRADVKVAAS